MAVVGEAKIVVRAITNTFKRDVERAAAGFNDAGRRAGEDFGDGVGEGYEKNSRRGLSRRFEATIEQARQQFRRLAIASNIALPAITGLLGIIGNLVSGLVILVAAAGNAAKAIGVGLLGAITAVAQAGITLGVAFRGFGEAMNQARGQAGAAANAARQEEAALRRLRDARLDLKRLIEEEAPAELAAARQAASDAADRAANSVRDAERAERRYNQAQFETLEALEDLNDARDAAREKLQQLRFELEGAAIGEKRARLEFEKARDSLQAVQDLPPDSRARQEAELAFAQAELNLRKAIDNNSDLRQEENAATQAGVEGSEEVVNAKERIANAIQAERDAAIEAAQAIRDSARAQQEANQAAADAAAGGRVERELQRRIALAREQVRDAEQAVADARRSVGGAGSDIRVTDEQLAFARYLRSLRDEFFLLRQAAGLELFPQLETALGNIVSGLFPTLQGLLRGTGDTLGQIAVGFSEVVTEGDNVKRLESVWTTNDELLRNLGIAGGNLYEALLLILEAAEPVITAFGEWAASSSAQFVQDLADKGDGLRQSFERNLEIFSDFKEIIDNLFGTFGNLGAIINEEGGAADTLLGYLQDITKEWERFTGSEEGKNYLRDFFEGSGENFQTLLEVIGLIGKGILEIGASEGFGAFLDSLKEVTVQFNALGLELAESGALASFGEALAGFAELLVNLTESGAITAFFDTFTGIFEFLNLIFGNETVQKILEFIAPIFAVGLAFGAAFRVLRFLGNALAGFIKILPGGSAFLARLGTGLNNFGKSLGTKLIAALKDAGRGLGKFFRNLGPKFREWFGQLAKRFGPAVSKFFAGLGPRILGFFKGLGPGAIARLGLFFNKILGPRGTLIAAAIAGIVFLIVKFKDEIWAGIQAIIDFFKYLFDVLVGNSIIPDLVNDIIMWFKNLFTDLLQRVQDGIASIISFFQDLPGKLAEFGSKIWNWIKEAWDTYWSAQQESFNLFVEGIRAIPGRIKEAGAKFWNWISELWEEYWTDQTSRFDNLVEDIKSLPGRLAEAGKNMWNWLKDSFKMALNWVIDRWNNLKFELRLPNEIRGVKLPGFLAGAGVTVETPNIPRLAMGGVVSPRSGGTLAMIAEAGRPERVEPLDSDGLSKRDRAMIEMLAGGGTGTTINVYPSPGMNETDLARKVSRELAKQVRRGSI